LYMKFQTKAMPLDRAHWEKEATRIYHPGERKASL